MSNNSISPSEFFNPNTQVANLCLIACPGAEELTNLIDMHLRTWAKEVGIDKKTFIVECACPRFQSGDAKGLVKESVRGDDIFFVVDPGNYSLTYNLFGLENHMSPDDHFANLKRLIQAAAGRAHRMTVIMPSLYGGRQHRRVVRESLDCAVALQELQSMGVENIITFDAHDPRLMNAVPLMRFCAFQLCHETHGADVDSKNRNALPGCSLGHMEDGAVTAEADDHFRILQFSIQTGEAKILGQFIGPVHLKGPTLNCWPAMSTIAYIKTCKILKVLESKRLSLTAL